MKAYFDYNPSTRTGSVKLEDASLFEALRFAFSTPNEAKKFALGPRARFVPDRNYFVTPSGSFAFGIGEMLVDWLRVNGRTEPEFVYGDGW